MKIAVLAGGTSTERDVSLITGKMVYKALKENGHQVVLVDVFMGYPGEDYKTLFTSDIDFSEQIRGRILWTACTGYLPSGGSCIYGVARC